jgi:glyoxylase I family protein
MAEIDILALDHVDLTVCELRRSTAFYDKILPALGMRRVAHESYVAWGNGHMNVGLREASPEHRETAFDRTRAGMHHLALRARSRTDVDRFHTFLVRERITVLDPPAEYPQYGPDYYAVFFTDPDGLKLEVVHFPWGYWRRVQESGHDERPRGARP